MIGRPWRAVPGGVLLEVRLTPKGGRDSIDGFETLADGRIVLKARVRAAPSEGEANSALVRLVGRWASIPSGRIHIVGGATTRIKRIEIEADSAQLIPALEKLARTR